MKIVKPDLNKIATVSIILVIGIYAMTHYIFHTESDFIIYKTGMIISLIGLFWFFYEKIGWRYSLFRLFNWLCETPNLNGRYEGYVNRNNENNPHSFIMEINQSFREISINTYSKNSVGKSITANIVKDGVGKYYLFYTWQCRTRKIDNPMVKEDFFGTSMIEISKDSNGKYQLEDDYYTRRNPPTSGETKLKFKSKTLLHRYE